MVVRAIPDTGRQKWSATAIGAIRPRSEDVSMRQAVVEWVRERSIPKAVLAAGGRN